MTSAARKNEDAIFYSGHEALRYAYNYSAQQYPMTIMGRMMRGKTVGSGRGLYGLDGAAIAGSVKRVVGSLPSRYHDALVCRYSQDEKERDAAIGRLLPVAAASLGTGTHKTRMVLKLIFRYFGLHPVKLAEMCDEFDMEAWTMTRRWKCVKRRLHELESQAGSAADDALTQAGLVQWR